MSLGTFLNDRPPIKLRGALFLALNETATILTRTAATDNGGGATYTWTSGAAVNCRIYPVTLRGQPRVLGGRIDERTTHFCVTPPGTNATTGQRFFIAGRGTFEITMALERSDALTVVYEVFQLD